MNNRISIILAFLMLAVYSLASQEPPQIVVTLAGTNTPVSNNSELVFGTLYSPQRAYQTLLITSGTQSPIYINEITISHPSRENVNWTLNPIQNGYECIIEMIDIYAYDQTISLHSNDPNLPVYSIKLTPRPPTGTVPFNIYRQFGPPDKFTVVNNQYGVPNSQLIARKENGTDLSYVDKNGEIQYLTFNVHSANGSNITSSSITVSGSTQLTVYQQITRNWGPYHFVLKLDPSTYGEASGIVNVVIDGFNHKFVLKWIGSAAEIEVRGNNILIADSDTSTNSNDGTLCNFVHGDEGEYVFRVNNLTPTISGSVHGALKIHTISFTGVAASEFHVVDPATPPTSASPLTIPPNEFVDIRVACKSESPGTKNAQLVLSNYDTNESTYNFSLRGIAATPGQVLARSYTNPGDADMRNTFAHAPLPNGEYLMGGSLYGVNGSWGKTLPNSAIFYNPNDYFEQVTPTNGVESSRSMIGPVFSILVDNDARQYIACTLFGQKYEGEMGGAARLFLGRTLGEKLAPPMGITPSRIDSEFAPMNIHACNIYCMRLSYDDKIYLAGGHMINQSDTSFVGLLRLDLDGGIDSTYISPILNEGGTVYTAEVLPDGSTIIGGNFTSINGVTRSCIARLNADGSLDQGWNMPVGGNEDKAVYALVNTAGGLVVAGSFNSINGQARDNIALLPRLYGDPFDYSLLSWFRPVVNGPIVSVAAQSNGDIIIGGGFTSVNGIERNNIAKLRTRAESSSELLDMFFNPNCNDSVFALSINEDGVVCATGHFTRVSGLLTNGYALLTNVKAVSNIYSQFDANPSDPSSGVIQWRRAGSAPDLSYAKFLRGDNYEGTAFVSNYLKPALPTSSISLDNSILWTQHIELGQSHDNPQAIGRIRGGFYNSSESLAKKKILD